MKTKWVAVLFLCFLCCLAPKESWGVDPYDNIALPQGSSLLAYPLYYDASKFKDKNGNSIATDPDAQIYENIFRYIYYNKTILPNTLIFSAVLPVGCMELLGDRDCGVGDLTALAGYWLIDDPAAKTWFGVGSFLDVPTGAFDENSSANMGSNTWKIRPVIAFAKQFGKIDLELTAKYNINTRNHDTDTTLGDEVIVEGYTGYFLQPDLLLGVHLNATWGQNLTVAGATVPESGVQIYQAGPSIFKNFGNGFTAMVKVLSDFAVENSLEGDQIQGRFSWNF